MADSTGGMGAEVGVRKMDDQGNVVEERNIENQAYSRVSWAILLLLIILSSFGMWKVLELMAIL